MTPSGARDATSDLQLLTIAHSSVSCRSNTLVCSKLIVIPAYSLYPAIRYTCTTE